MSADDQQLPVALPTTSRVGQATAIEQTRAVAEVRGAIMVAQDCPRSLSKAQATMRQSCAQEKLADRAFFRYSRGGGQITGPTVHLARELARCFGNVDYGIAELSRDDEFGQSEMKAWAWDVEMNTRASTTFIVPHKRDTKDGPKRLIDMRDLYENNSNMGARRLREQIFAILPPWFVEEAKDICNATIRHGGGVPLPTRIADAIKTYGKEGIDVEQLETKLGRKADRWTEHDVAALRVIAQSISRGESTKEEEFPPVAVSAAELISNGAAHLEKPIPVTGPAEGDVGDGWPGAVKPGEG